jgi:hypothetical protein
LENKTQIGKVEEILGSVNNVVRGRGQTSRLTQLLFHKSSWPVCNAGSMQAAAGACLRLLVSWTANAHQAASSSGADASWQELPGCELAMAALILCTLHR